jgi:hypothetical protein
MKNFRQGRTNNQAVYFVDDLNHKERERLVHVCTTMSELTRAGKWTTMLKRTQWNSGEGKPKQVALCEELPRYRLRKNHIANKNAEQVANEATIEELARAC